MKYLGIDYGRKKIGLAHSEGFLATPFKVLEIHSLKDALQQIITLIRSEEFDQVVVGLPESGESRELVEKFLQELKQQNLPVLIHTIPETLSSQEASQRMIKLKLPRKKRQQEDAYAAAIILDNFLESSKDF